FKLNIVFFFSSRRRHTRFSRDWSSDVCSSDLYYRVRMGNFRSREAAERAREFLAQRFPDAFIVPDTVEITRWLDLAPTARSNAQQQVSVRRPRAAWMRPGDRRGSSLCGGHRARA